ncbi:MAG: peptidylprolyl isomerase, partial [Gemmatimonadota bacterium]|nr:peptidylprolyl isomerase [Gemmatimonadota bacterium]
MLIIETTLGTIKCELYSDKTPMTVEMISSLAEGTREWTHPETGETMTGTPYYDGVLFHRVIPNFMIQTGDPLGTGMGGPGFMFDDELREELRFDQPGRVAMAHRGPNTNGGQIFITVAPTPHLDMVHTIFGQVVEGQEVADAISE